VNVVIFRKLSQHLLLLLFLISNPSSILMFIIYSHRSQSSNWIQFWLRWSCNWILGKCGKINQQSWEHLVVGAREKTKIIEKESETEASSTKITNFTSMSVWAYNKCNYWRCTAISQPSTFRESRRNLKKVENMKRKENFFMPFQDWLKMDKNSLKNQYFSSYRYNHLECI
jgi:hypothetical protein